MKLVIREYLSMLKESGELDLLLPDLLLAMGIKPLSKAQGGVRQYGVDVAAVGQDPNDQAEKLFLLTIKKGDLSRNNWDVGKQALRPSLNEILDTYITNYINEEHKTLTKKIIVCCNGDIKQEAEQSWNGYKKSNSKPGLEFDFWGADNLAMMIESYLLDEYIFPEQSRKHLRKTIALAEENEEPRHFYALIEESLFDKNKYKNQQNPSDKESVKFLTILNLNLNIVFHWCLEANNLKPAILCAERSILRGWDFLIKHQLFWKKKVVEKYYQIVTTYSNIIAAFINKIKPYCSIKHGLFGWAEAEQIEYPLRTFEIIGILGSYGVYLWDISLLNEDRYFRASCLREINKVGDILSSLIANNPSASNPLYDRHANDINLGMIVLCLAKKTKTAKYLLKMMASKICQGYQLGHHFPIHTNSYQDLVNITVNQSITKEKLFKASTIIPVLADWYAILDWEEEYVEFQKSANKLFPHTNFMLWFPDRTTESHFYNSNAGRSSGVGVELPLHQSLSEIKARIIKLQEKYSIVYENMSCVKNDAWFLIAIASRHFQTPVVPFLWHQLIKIDDNFKEK